MKVGRGGAARPDRSEAGPAQRVKFFSINMPYHHFQIPCGEASVAEAAMNGFLAGKSVLGIERHFVADGPRSFWAYCAHVAPSAGLPPGRPLGKTVDYREILEPETFTLFAQLREWRKATAEQEGCPPFTIFTNEQLAEIARRLPSSVAEMQKIQGVGPAKGQKYGEAVMGLLQKHAAGKEEEE